ncbi:MAG: hypothetical protein LC641_00910 [Spirochaeta sp.]|nr:hypothetical protein [Spirochaeta sp.]
MDRAIEWSDGRVVRMEVAVDVTDSMTAREELLKSQQNWRVAAGKGAGA